MENKKRIICFMILSMLAIALLVGCGEEYSDKEVQNVGYKYNVTNRENPISKQEKINNDLIDITNKSRGYITAWDTVNIDFMNSTFNNIMNGTIRKENFIDSYTKDPDRMMRKMQISRLSITSYSDKAATVKINTMVKITQPFVDEVAVKAGNVILTFINANNVWLIANISIK